MRLKQTALLTVLILLAAVFPARAEVALKADLLVRARAQGAVRVSVLLKSPSPARDNAPGPVADNPALSRQVLAALDPAQVQLVACLENVPAFIASLTPAGLSQLAAREEVVAISPDMTVKALTAPGIALINPEEFRSGYGGAGLSIAIIDSGIDYNHDALGGGGFPNSKVLGGYDFGDADADPLDCNSHGTSVAGIAAGSDTEVLDYIGGVAPEAKLYALKVTTGCSDAGPLSNVLLALDWAVSHQMDDPDHPIMVVNVSFGGGIYDSPCDDLDPVAAALLATTQAAGMSVFVASGNDGQCQSMAAPACFSGAVSVGAVYNADLDRDIGFCVDPASCVAQATSGCATGAFCQDSPMLADQPACFSNTASFLDLLAPSYATAAPWLNNSYTLNFGGTSAAAPYAAGAAAVIQSYWKSATGAWLSEAELLSRMKDGGQPILDNRNGLTFPRVDIARAGSGISGVIDLDNCTQQSTTLVGPQVAYFRLEVPTNAVKLTALATAVSGDLDIYLKYGSQPTLTDYDCRSTRGSFMDETCQAFSPRSGYWYLTVRAKENGSGMIRMCWETDNDYWWW